MVYNPYFPSKIMCSHERAREKKVGGRNFLELLNVRANDFSVSVSLFLLSYTIQSFIANKWPCRNRKRCTNNMLISQASRFFSFVIQRRRMAKEKFWQVTNLQLMQISAITKIIALALQINHCRWERRKEINWTDERSSNAVEHSFFSSHLSVCDLSRDRSEAHQMVLPVGNIDADQWWLVLSFSGSTIDGISSIRQ